MKRIRKREENPKMLTPFEPQVTELRSLIFHAAQKEGRQSGMLGFNP